jgi:hypothetical protein
MKKALMLLALLLTIGAAVRADDYCYPAQCAYGYHSVCVTQCDPNKPVCEKVCKCHCEKDQKDKNPEPQHVK